MEIMRPVNFCSITEDPRDQGMIEKALQHIPIGMFTLVGSVEEADLVVFSSLDELRSVRCGSEKFFAFFRKLSVPALSLPENCAIVDPSSIVWGLKNVMEDVQKKLTSTVEIQIAPTQTISPDKRRESSDSFRSSGVKRCFQVG
jgi:hypothetical protein